MSDVYMHDSFQHPVWRTSLWILKREIVKELIKRENYGLKKPKFKFLKN